MPSSITHAYIAKDVYEALNTHIKKRISEEYLNNFIIYSFNADVLYFYKILAVYSSKAKKIQKLGSYVHNNKTNEFLINITNKVKKSKDNQEFTLLMGFITHYIADSTLHPFINYKSNLIINKDNNIRDTHFIIETYIDNYYVNKRENIDYRKYKFYETLNLDRNENIVNLLNSSFLEVFGESNIGEYYFEAVKDMKNFFHYLRYDPSRFKWYFYQVANVLAKKVFRDVRYLSYNFPLDKDEFCFNTKKENWYNIHNPKLVSNKSFFELYEDVVNKSAEVIEKVYDYVYENKDVNLEELFENKFYGTGLKLK